MFQNIPKFGKIYEVKDSKFVICPSENHHANAMDLILAINQRTPVTRRFHVAAQQMNEERVKRMNVTKFSNGSMVITNTSQVLNATDVMLQVNLGRYMDRLN